MVNPWRDLSGLPAAAWALAAATFVNRAGSMVLSFLALYLSKDRGLTRDDAASVASLFGLTSRLMAPIAGRLADRIGAGLVVAISRATGGIAYLLYPLAHGMLAILAATVLASACAEPFRPASLVLISAIVPPELLRRAFVLQRLAINLGFALGGAVGGLLAESDYRLIFWVNGGALLLSFAVLISFPSLIAVRGGRDQAVAGESPLGDKRVIWFLAATFLAAIVFFQHMAALSLFMVGHLGLKERHYGWAITVNTLLIVFVEPRLNASMAGWHHGRAIALGALCSALGLGALAFCNSLGAVIATVPLWTLGEMIMFPTMSQVITELAPKGRTGATMGLYAMSFSLAFTVGPKLGVTILEGHGPFVCWLLVLALGLVPAAMFLKLDLSARPARSSNSGGPTT